ncbi:MAG: ABC transporter substrate-binding protein [Spirochaetes bacterium]|nr:ABC transporter substrate-binding protein [Spirochaetota bacterium]
MKKPMILIAVLCCAATFAFGQVNPGVKAVDSLGMTISLPKAAARVVSLAPASTEILFAVGAKVVGDTTYCLYPPEALEIPKIGGFSADSMSIEKILSLKPDLVVSNGKIHRAVTEILARYGIVSYAYDPAAFEQIGQGMVNLGRLTGNEAKGGAAAAAFLDKIENVKKALSGLTADQKPTVFWEVYDEPLMTCGSPTFLHEIIETAGGRDIFSDLKTAWPVVSSEAVLARAPQVIMGADDHGEKLTFEALSKRPGWPGLPALRNRRIILLPAALVSAPGTLIADGVLAAAKALHPELFK